MEERSLFVTDNMFPQDSLELLSPSDFFRLVDQKLELEEEVEFCLVAIDLEHFKLFNKWYGRKEGNRFLRAIAAKLHEMASVYKGLAGYFGGDNFALFIPAQAKLIDNLQKELCGLAMQIGNSVGFLPAIGIYQIEERSMSAVAMYDLAEIALSHVFGNYEKRICVYSSAMTDKIAEELRLISEIKDALRNREFTFYAQPKCRVKNGKVVGAEALVRWIHPTKGLIPPNVFIPVLEKNGFIGDLDRYVWEEVCRWLRSWMDKGYEPIPISINVSRIDILTMDVVDFLVALTEKYDVDHKYLKVEITESAYTENAEKIMSTIKDLREQGFSILMDDFGSGYSSLNMLRSVIVDVIKIDMRFLDIAEDEEEKGFSILESVVNMSGAIGVPIIVEGVETKKHEEYLIGMGCRYAQGYYYYRPLPIVDFEKIISQEENIDHRGIYSKKVEQLHLREFLDSSMFNDTLLNNILGPVAFYELYEDDIKITRVNEQYYQLAGVASGNDTEYSKKIWKHLERKDRSVVMRVFKEAFENPMFGATDFMDFVRADGSYIKAKIRLYFLREDEGRKLYFGILAQAWDETEAGRGEKIR